MHEVHEIDQGLLVVGISENLGVGIVDSNAGAQGTCESLGHEIV